MFRGRLAMTFCFGSLSYIVSKVHNNSYIQGKYPLKPLKENNSSTLSPSPYLSLLRERISDGWYSKYIKNYNTELIFYTI